MELPRSLGIPEVFVDEAGHLEHRDLTAPKDGAEILIGVDHAAVLRILKTLTLDVPPQFLGHFGARHCAAADSVGEITARLLGFNECRVRRVFVVRSFSTTGLPTVR